MPDSAKTAALLHLIRFDKPIGTLLLLWPTLIALWVAAQGMPDLKLLFIFCVGTFLTRSAGCIANDLADRDMDGSVQRTQGRPLVTGVVTPKEALALAVILTLMAFLLVLFTNRLTVLLSFAAVALAVSYPFIKRYSNLPQIVLGLAFSWGIPMAFAAQLNTLPTGLWLWFLGNLVWTVVYDTKYAMVDREDDLEIGIKSTAILFGQHDRLVIGLLQLLCLLIWITAGMHFELALPYYLSLVAVAGLFLFHQHLIRERSQEACFKAFLHNNWVGFTLFLGVALSYAL
jgi:4-hydroxybenzoate polyprenyltransferase